MYKRSLTSSLQALGLNYVRNRNVCVSLWSLSYPVRKTSASFKNATFIKMGKGNLSIRAGNLTIASDCSPRRGDRNPKFKKQNNNY